MLRMAHMMDGAGQTCMAFVPPFAGLPSAGVHAPSVMMLVKVAVCIVQAPFVDEKTAMDSDPTMLPGAAIMSNRLAFEPEAGMQKAAPLATSGR